MGNGDVDRHTHIMCMVSRIVAAYPDESREILAYIDDLERVAHSVNLLVGRQTENVREALIRLRNGDTE